MNTSIKHFLVLFLFLISFGFSYAEKTPRDSIKMRIKDKSLSDSIRISNIVAYSMSWPRPPFYEMFPILEEGLKLATKNKFNELSRQLLAEKIKYYVENNKGIEAFSVCQDMIRLGEKDSNFTTLGNAYYLRGWVFLNFNMLPKAIEEQKKSITYYGKTNNKDELSNSNYLLAWYSFNNQDYKTALSGFTFAYKYTLGKKNPYSGQLGEYSGWIGNSYSALKQFDSAIYYRKLSLTYFREDIGGQADSYRYLGNIYRNMKQYDSAMANYKRSFEIFDKVKNLGRKWLVQYFIAETYATLKNYTSSAKELDRLLDSVSGTKDLLSLELGNRLGSKVYEKNNEYKKALICFQKYVVYKDSSAKTGQQGALTELDAKLKFEQEEALFKLKQAEKDAAAKRDREKQKLVRNFLIGGFCVLALFLIFVYRNYQQKQKANKLLQVQKNEIEYQKKEIQDSINYAQNIQKAVLPDPREIEKHFSEMFILYKPKDVVSGDFYWMQSIPSEKNKGKDAAILIAAADCTGHGVPGAFMSMIGSYELNNSVLERGILQPSKILAHINVSLKNRLKQNEEQSKNRDGMDIVLCSFDLKKMELQYAGANRPLFIVRNGESLEYSPTKTAIGGFTANDKEFENKTIPLQKGDCIYLYTDGYADQFGGPKNKKLTTKTFKGLLLDNSSKSMKSQKAEFDKYLSEWKGNYEQLDDVLVIGIRI